MPDENDASYLAKAKIMRLLVVMTLIVAKTRQTRGILDIISMSMHQTMAQVRILHEKTCSSDIALGGVDENLKQRPGSRADDLVYVASNEEQNNEEDGAGEGTDGDADDHDLGTFDGRTGNFCIILARQAHSNRGMRCFYLQSCGQPHPEQRVSWLMSNCVPCLNLQKL